MRRERPGPGRDRAARALNAVVAAAGLWTVATACGAGFMLHLGPLRLSSNEPLRPLLLTAVAAGLSLLLFGPAQVRRDVAALTRISPRLAQPAAIALALLTMALGLRYGTWLAGGSDSYGYVSQADLWLNGSLHVLQPWAAQFDWPQADWTFAPLAYRPGLAPNTIVPSTAPGVSMLMALMKLVAGGAGPFLVTPLLAALGVWLTFRLGRTLAGPAEGVLASLLLAASPAMLMNVMFPMSDIPAMAFWTLAVVLALSKERLSPLLAGLAVAVAVLIRPNVVPLAVVPGLAAMWRPRGGPGRLGSLLRAGALFAAGVAPGVFVVALVNTRLYGGPLASGYGPLAALFVASRALANVAHWAAWLWDTQPVVAVLAPLGLILPGALARGHAALLPGIIAVTAACYLFYEPFDDWWFLRFLFPMFPALMILAAAALMWLVRRLPQSWRVPVVAVCVVAVASSQLRAGKDRLVFDLQEGANHSLATAREVGRLVPENAMILCIHESGTLRYYANRLTLRWDWLPPEWLDRAIDRLQARGYRPYIFLPEDERRQFLTRFSGTNAGRLAGKPVAEFPPSGTLYDAVAARAAPPQAPAR